MLTFFLHPNDFLCHTVASSATGIPHTYVLASVLAAILQFDLKFQWGFTCINSALLNTEHRNTVTYFLWVSHLPEHRTSMRIKFYFCRNQLCTINTYEGSSYWKNLFRSSFPTKILHAFLICLMCAACPHFIILHLTTLTALCG